MTNSESQKIKVGIVIPCFNEARRLDVNQFTQLAMLSGVDWLIVDDGSTDDTLGVLNSIESNETMRVLSLPHNLGKSEAIRFGLNQLLIQDQYKGVGFLDADSSISVDSIAMILTKFRDMYSSEYDMVWSSRIKLSGRKIYRSKKRHLIGRLISVFLGYGYLLPYDSQCGYKIFKTTPGLVKSLEKSFQTKWFIDLEILMRCKQHDVGTTVWEEPIGDWKEVPGSKITFSQSLRIVSEIIYIRKTIKKIRFTRQELFS
jgi:glycosyltransferase involved in cell wall biosynthesis